MPGLLVYIMGPSGAGKDSLIDAARPAFRRAGVEVARRVITRSAESVGEQAEGVTPEDFQKRSAAGEFALSWQANGLNYGIPIDMNAHLDAGVPVVVNGSRAHLPVALRRYPQLLAILIAVEPAILRDRLIRRGRETLADIERRLDRGAGMPYAELTAGMKVEVVDNSVDLQSGVHHLLQVLEGYGIAFSGAGDRT